MDHIDLFLLHWPAISPNKDLTFNHKPVHKIWAELEECVKMGLTKSIGVSNFNC